MSSRVQLEPAYVLHRRPYSNSSLILDLLTLNHGRMSVLARSARGHKSRYKGNLELFSPLLLSWSGRGDLKSLGNAELTAAAHRLDGAMLWCGFYLNELLMRFLQREDPCPNLFLSYKNTLDHLKNTVESEKALRYFEKNLLRELGYGLPLQREAITGLPIQADQSYSYTPDLGFVHELKSDSVSFVFSGRALIAFDEECLSTELDLKEIKQLMRVVLARHLSGKPLQSRLLFSATS